MKPKFWIAKTDFASLADENDACDALHQCATISRNGCKILPDDVPLYTSEQLAKAVAAERERCAKVCEDKAQTIMQEHGSLPDFETGEVTLGELSQEAFEAFEIAAEAIRSAAK